MDEQIQTGIPGVRENTTVVDVSHARERQAFEAVMDGDDDGLGFRGDYLALMDEGWYWRDAAYIAWKSMPRDARRPATEDAFCKMIGITRRAMVRRRQKNRMIDARAAKLTSQLVVENMDDIIAALVESASNPSYKNHNDRKLALEMGGVYTPKQTHVLQPGGADDMAELSDEELMRQAQIGAGQAEENATNSGG